MDSARDELEALPRFCTIKETMEFLCVSRSTVMRYIESGDLDAWTMQSGRRKVRRDSIARLCGIAPREQ